MDGRFYAPGWDEVNTDFLCEHRVLTSMWETRMSPALPEHHPVCGVPEDQEGVAEDTSTIRRASPSRSLQTSQRSVAKGTPQLWFKM